MLAKSSGIIACQKNSFIDFPGTVSTVLFFGGCNLRCPFCHNPQIVRNEFPEIQFDSICNFLSKRRGSIDGVVLSGGEPTLYPHLFEIVSELRSMGLLIKIDTNGLNPDAIKRCNPDYLAVDIKTVPQRYPELGCLTDNFVNKLSETVDIVKQMGVQAEIRIPVSSRFITISNITDIAGMLDGVEKVFLQPLKIQGEILDPAFSQTDIDLSLLEAYREIIGRRVTFCSIRGI